MELCVHNYIEATRLAKLTSLQEKFLKHAMNAFPKAKRIVYSTCSVFPEENERVITNVVKASRTKWKVQDVKELLKGQWNNFGSSMYGSMGARCMYAKPDSDFTIGFFLAVLDRDPKDAEKSQNKELRNAKLSTENVTEISNAKKELNDNYESYSKKSKKRKHAAREEIQPVDVTEHSEKKKKKKTRTKAENGVNGKTEKEDICDEPSEIQIDDVSLETVKNKKKKKQKSEEHDSPALAETDVVQQDTKKKKKKRKDVMTTNNDSVASDTVDETHTVDLIEKSAKKKKHKRKDLIETAEN